MSAPLWLVAHDLTALSNNAAAEAGRMAAASGGRLMLLHVYPPALRDIDERDALEDEERAMLRSVADRLRGNHPDLRIDLEVIEGDATTRIGEEAERNDAHYVVVGTHDRRGLARLVLGSVAEAVVRESRVPVMVVKGPTAEQSLPTPLI